MDDTSKKFKMIQEDFKQFKQESLVILTLLEYNYRYLANN